VCVRVSIRTNLHENPSSLIPPPFPASLTRLNQHSLFEQQATGSRRMESKDIISRAMPTNTGAFPPKKVQSAGLLYVVLTRASCRVFLILGEPAAADRGTSARNPEAMSSTLLGHASTVIATLLSPVLTIESWLVVFHPSSSFQTRHPSTNF
jgi:hypothetical protein